MNESKSDLRLALDAWRMVVVECSMKDEALRLALEALKTCQIDGDGWSGPHYDFDDVKVGKAIIAIRQALEQPVATNDTSKDRVDETAKQRHEPVATVYEGAIAKWNLPEKFTGFLYTSPPKREWQRLTDQEIDKTYETKVWDARRSYARAIEAKLKEKNT